MAKKIFILLLLTLLSQFSYSATVKDVKIYSNAMNKDIRNLIIVPDDNSDMKKFPVVYLLHGYGCDYMTWMDMKPELPEISDRLGIIFVCPDGGNSWYWDSDFNPSSKYETFISSELTDYVDKHFPTIPSPGFRAITGSSMGGHGALWIAIRHQDIFEIAGSIHGGVDFTAFPEKWEIEDQLGKFSDNQQAWFEHTVISQLNLLHDGDLAISFECGENDEFFLECNEALHKLLEARRISHDYSVRPGHHDKEYCRNAIDYQILFFVKQFYRRGFVL